eukprot:UC1_evm2s1683
MTGTVLVTRSIWDEHLQRIRDAGYELRVYEGEGAMPRAEVLAGVGGAAGILCMLTDPIDDEVLEAAGPNLKIVSTMSVGHDHVDKKACRARNVAVGNTPGVLTDSTADLTLTLLLAAARRVPEALHAAKSGAWGTWSPDWLCGLELAGCTVGIVGLGRIGAAVGRRVLAFGIGKLCYTGRAPRPAGDELGAEHVDLDTLLRTSDVVIATCALTDATRNLFNADAFGKMKSGAVFVNTARGGVVDQDALVAALRDDGQPLAAAGIDVTTPEPLPTDHPLFKLDNCVVLPHIGSATLKTRKAMADLAVDNLLAGLAGEALPAAV